MFNVSTLYDEEREALVCLYFARIPHDRQNNKRKEYWDILSKRYNKRPNTYKNYTQDFEPYFQENGRTGWVGKSKNSIKKSNRIVLEQYKDMDIQKLALIADEIIKLCEQELAAKSGSYVALRIMQSDIAHELINGTQKLVIDGVQDLQEVLEKDPIVFVALGGQYSDIDWTPGFRAIAHVSEKPYDVGYKRGEGNKPYFRFEISVDHLLSRSLTRNELIDYPDTYDASYIGVEFHRDRTQAISLLDESKAVAIIRATIDLMPKYKDSMEKIFPEEFKKKIYESTTMQYSVDVNYGQSVRDALIERFANNNNAKCENEKANDSYDSSGDYTKKEFLDDVFINPEQYDLLKNVLTTKKNVILQGPPGVGKTFMAKKLAYSIIGKKIESRIKMVQFHQSYTYEDFIAGYRPSENGFILQFGPFYDFCKEAEKSKEPYFFIIDEINRGNVSKIFGELLMLIEADKRDEKLKLLYKDNGKEIDFSIPSNVHIIGTMNTADRSLAIIDYALRRRFAFFDVHPAFKDPASAVFIERMKPYENTALSRLLEYVKAINNDIDDTLGEGFEIGHSYFCVDKETVIDQTWISSVVDFSIIPLLKEYWFDDPDRVDSWTEKLREIKA